MEPYLQSSYLSSSALKTKGPVTQKMAQDEYGDDVEEEGAVDETKFGRAPEKKKKSSLFVVDDKGSGSGGGGSGGGTASLCCQVEKCEADLTDSKKYHKRHKVCEVHAKAPVVVVAGSRQRFCQQCSRFHVLTEFDDTKRSCRRRLAGHNERRRKSSTESRGESSSRRGPSQYEKENQCRPVDGRETSLSNFHIH
ncbi:hypothetical protein Leryth_010073 [Lithospermum erythrorhizon]|uniref:SBP-type domain-containing protein n=1 Tax=Lithospermum erythrorhizon TaxID=34254 RepID=A0AAV3PLC1_LITER|nr:hypothetical protein Leryth_010073 [Lithospermum erythrorhizon]